MKPGVDIDNAEGIQVGRENRNIRYRPPNNKLTRLISAIEALLLMYSSRLSLWLPALISWFALHARIDKRWRYLKAGATDGQIRRIFSLKDV